MDIHQHLIDGLRNALQVQAGTRLGERVREVQQLDPAFPIAVAATLDMKGTVASGRVELLWPAKTLAGLLARMFGEKVTSLKPEQHDIAGEVLNITYCQARKPLNEGGLDLAPAIPRLEDPSTPPLATGNVRYFCLVSPFGPLWMRVTLHTLPGENAA